MDPKQWGTQMRAGGQDVECTGQQHTQDQGDTRGAERRTHMDVQEKLTDPGEKQSQGIMDDRKKVQTIIKKVHPKLRSHLNLNEEFLIELKATDPEVISDEEHDEIRMKTGAKRVDHLLELIKKKTTGAFFSLMEVLERKDGDLYKMIKEVQETIFTGRPPRGSNHVTSTATPPHRHTATPPLQQTPTNAVPQQQAPTYSADMFHTQQAVGPLPVTSALWQTQILPTPVLQPLYQPRQQFASQQMVQQMSPANINMQPYIQPLQQPPPPVAPAAWTPSAPGTWLSATPYGIATVHRV